MNQKQSETIADAVRLLWGTDHINHPANPPVTTLIMLAQVNAIVLVNLYSGDGRAAAQMLNNGMVPDIEEMIAHLSRRYAEKKG